MINNNNNNHHHHHHHHHHHLYNDIYSMDLAEHSCLMLIEETTNQTESRQNKANQNMLVFGERRKPEYPGKNLLLQSREPTNSTHV